jgi:hypothetical protein
LRRPWIRKPANDCGSRQYCRLGARQVVENSAFFHENTAIHVGEHDERRACIEEVLNTVVKIEKQGAGTSIAVCVLPWDRGIIHSQKRCLALEQRLLLLWASLAEPFDVGHNGLSIPVRNRKGVRSLVSFTSNHSKDDYDTYKSRNMIKLQTFQGPELQ